MEYPLYQDAQISIDLLRNDRGRNINKYEILMCEPKQTRYILPRKVLNELATSSRPDIAKKLETMYPELLNDLEQRNLTYGSIGVAICQAYIEDGRRFEKWMAKNCPT